MKEFVKISETTTTKYVTKRIVIPKEISKALDFNKGDKVLLEVQGDKLIVSKA